MENYSENQYKLTWFSFRTIFLKNVSIHTFDSDIPNNYSISLFWFIFFILWDYNYIWKHSIIINCLLLFDIVYEVFIVRYYVHSLFSRVSALLLYLLVSIPGVVMLRLGSSSMANSKYRKISNIRRTKSLNLNVSRLGLQLSLRNILKPSVGWRVKK